MLKGGSYVGNGVKASLDNPQNVKNSQENAQNLYDFEHFYIKFVNFL